jgi:eukaryotic-like serine/threonine-protein kinase
VNVGDTIAGRYRLDELLGVGGMSSVYRAHDRVLERDVAVKVLHDHYTHDEEYVERFRREARAIARLSHPNIVTVIDRGEADGCQFIVFEHVRGENLKEVLRGAGPLPVTTALTLAHQAARGLAFAHENGIVHRDVKPQNVLVDEDGVAKVTDFGIARSSGPDEGLTQSGTILGTSDYLSPEQAVGSPVDERSDQYSLGVLLYELLTGEVPFPGESMVAVAMRHVNDPVPSVRDRRGDVSSRVDALVRRAMAKRPEERFPTMDALIAALEACLAEEAADRVDRGAGATQVLAPVRASGAGASRVRERPARGRAKRRRVPWQLVAGALVLAAAGALVAALATGRFDPAGGGDGARAGRAAVTLRAEADFDPFGDEAEHPETVSAATDGDRETYWTTETYSSFAKEGVGLVLDAGRAVELARLRVVSDEAGFTARIRAGAASRGPFEDVSEEQTVDERTDFQLDTGGTAYRYYLLWITGLERRAHVNEVRAG